VVLKSVEVYSYQTLYLPIYLEWALCLYSLWMDAN